MKDRRIVYYAPGDDQIVLLKKDEPVQMCFNGVVINNPFRQSTLIRIKALVKLGYL